MATINEKGALKIVHSLYRMDASGLCVFIVHTRPSNVLDVFVGAFGRRFVRARLPVQRLLKVLKIVILLPESFEPRCAVVARLGEQFQISLAI